LDTEGRIIAILVGCPPESTWNEVINGMTEEFTKARQKNVFSSPADDQDRRGDFPKINVGYSFGGGQTVSPGPTQSYPAHVHHPEAPK
jgi:hypothetical protein